MAYAELKIKPEFGDGTTGDDIVLGPYATNAPAIMNSKTNIKAFNSNVPVAFRENFVNESDEIFVRWSEAHIITVERTNYTLG